MFIGIQADASTVAYWRFEEGPLNANVARGGQADGAWYPGALDSSGNGYALSAWSNGGYAGEAYRSQVPTGQVPLSGAVNNFSLQSTGDVPGMWTQTGAGIQTWKPTAWTVECWLRSTSINNWRVAVGRDGDDVGGRDDPPFRLMMTNASAIRVNFTDMAGVYHELNTSNGFVQSNQWYHAAATSDGTTFRLYVNGNLIGETLLDNTTDARLSDGSNGRAPDANWAPGNWTVFRGMWNGGHSDRWFGYIDEVRLSDVALTPGEFLNSYVNGTVTTPHDRQVWPAVGNPVTFSVNIIAPLGATVTDVQWYKKAVEGDPNIPVVDDNTKYDIEWAQTDSSLTIYNGDVADAYRYAARVTFSNSTEIISGSAALTVAAGLVHRWSFSGDLKDSVGSADGTLYDPSGLSSYVDGDTGLLLDNPAIRPQDSPDGIAYVNLPDGIVSALDNDMTIELWVTPHRINGSWTSLYAFGVADNPDPTVFSGGQGILLQQQVEASGPGFTYQVENSTRWRTSTLPIDEQAMMLAMVWDGNAGQGRFYLNGAEVDNAVLPGTLSAVNDVDNLVGAAWWNDQMVNATFTEMRIYDTPLPPEYITEHYSIGPDLLQEAAGLVITPADPVVHEEGPTSDDLFFSLEYEPADSVVLTIQEQNGRGQVTLDPTTLTFTLSNWNVPQPIHVTAVDDAVLENADESVPLSVTVSSVGDSDYNGLQVDPVIVKVIDNECGAWGYAAGDFNADCFVDFYDFVIFADGWLDCSDPDQVNCTNYAN